MKDPKPQSGPRSGPQSGHQPDQQPDRKHWLQLADSSRLPLDEKGYLLDPGQWTEEVSRLMAAADGVDLSADHWTVLQIFRDYFARFDIDPPMRALVRAAREQLGEDKGNSRYLYRLFPAGPATQACRYAGLPRPISCI